MRTGTLAALFVVSFATFGCGPSEADIKKREQEAAERAKQEMADKEAAAAAAAQEQENAEQQAANERLQRIATLAQTIKSKLDPTGITSANDQAAVAQQWQVQFGKLDGTRWEWTEQEEARAANSYGGYGEAYDRLTYTVDPRDLAISVNVTTYLNMPAARISCKSSDCIHVTGVSGRSTGNVAVDEYRDDNYFPTPNKFDAQAVSSAMRELIGLANETPDTKM